MASGSKERNIGTRLEMSVLTKLTISTMFIAAFLIGQTAWATTYYVDPLLPGSDSNNGTSEATPFLTFMRCHTAVTAGDTCLFKNGDYTMSSPGQFRLTKSGTSIAPITFKNYPGHLPRIRSTSKSTPGMTLFFDPTSSVTAPSSYWNFEGFEITDLYGGLNCSNCDHVTFRHIICHDNYLGCFGGGGKYITIDSNTLYHWGRLAACQGGQPNLCNQDQGIYLTGTFITITNNLIYNGLAYGIQVAGYPFDPASEPDVSYSGASNWLVANNTIAYMNYGGGIVVWQSAATNDIFENNIFYENCNLTLAGSTPTCDPSYSQGIGFQSAGGGHIIRNNLAYATAPGSLDAFGGSGGWTGDCGTSGNICTSNPNMVNAPSTIPAAPDFRLQSSSPAIDKGLTQSLVTVDFVGAPRPQGSGYDIGAYEGVSSSDPSPTAPQGLTVR